MKTVFRVVSFLEGVSYVLLLFVATPLKYLQGDATYVKLLGMPHGILFMLYIVLAYVMRTELKWNKKDFIIVLICSIIPFGAFYMDKKYMQN